MAVWTPSPARSLVLPVALPLPRGLIQTPIPMRWPDKRQSERLDFSVSYANRLQAHEVILFAAAAVGPSGAGDLAIDEVVVSGAAVAVWHSGGQPGTDYAVRVRCRTSLGRSFESVVRLLVVTDTTTNFGPDSEWNAPEAPPSPAFLYFDALNFRCWPFGLAVTGPAVPIDTPPGLGQPSPALIFNLAENFGAWPFGLGVVGQSVGGGGSGGSSVPVPSLNFTVPGNFAVWGQFGGAIAGPVVPV